MTTRTQVVSGIALVAVGIVIGGGVGGVAALAAVLLAAWRGHRGVALVALVLLVLTAVLTVVEAPTTGQAPDYLFDFARDRPLAAEAGRIAGVFVLVSVVLAAIGEREPSSRAHEGGTSG